MCGIAGIIHYNERVTSSQLQQMCDALRQRGPDAAGYFTDEGVGLGHRRLSVIDLETGEQPMYAPDRQQVIVFNGEIYNFQELRNELHQQGVTFRTHSDTEVLLHGYRVYGMEKLLAKLEGMFAFALFDQSIQTLWVVRDRFGEKPLYFTHDSQRFLFASELKALVGQLPERTIDPNALNLFLSLSYIPAPYSIYAGVRKLEAGKGLRLHVQTGEQSSFTYFDAAHGLKQPLITDFEGAKHQLREHLYRSVRQRMVADVPLGAFLSGGIDSSIVTAIMADVSDRPINTFSIGFQDKLYDESERAELLARHVGARHQVQFLDYADVLPLAEEIVGYYDEPFGDSSALPSFFVSKLARQHVTVVLTGDCADELFGGYEKYLAPYYTERFQALPAPLRALVKGVVRHTPHTPFTNPWLRRAKKVLHHADLSPFDLHYSLMCLGLSDAERSSLLQPAYFVEIKPEVEKVYQEAGAKTHPLDRGFHTDLRLVLEGDMLAKVDRVCMKNSLEARVPFLDSGLVAFAQRLPVHFKIKGRNKKYILKETFKDLLPPETLAFRKKGFGVPIDHWMHGALKEEISDLLSPEYLQQQGIFAPEPVTRLWAEHLSGKENHKGKLWNLYVFQKWHQKQTQV